MFFDSGLIFDDESDDVVEFPKSEFFKIVRNKVWIQPLSKKEKSLLLF